MPEYQAAARALNDLALATGRAELITSDEWRAMTADVVATLPFADDCEVPGHDVSDRRSG